LLTAATLLDCGGRLTREVLVDSWRRRIIEAGGMHERGGRPLYGAVANLERGMLPPLSGRDNVMNDDDGAAMRIAPIGIICAGDPQRAAALAKLEAEMSHDGDGVWAAQAVAASVALAMVEAPLSEVVAAGRAQIPHDSWLGRAMARALEIAASVSSVEEAWEPLHTEFWTPVHSVAAEAVPQIYALLQLTKGDFQQAMYWGCNFGRDADTIGAVLGAITGALHGVSVIPPAWIERAARPSGVCLKFTSDLHIPTIAEQLAELIVCSQ
jgi:ADP-ribosylglycohydrolase